MSKFCRFCGTELNEENKFCTNCGKSTGAEIVYVKTDNEKKNSIQIALAIIISLSIVSLFLPYFSVLGFSASYFETFEIDANIILICQLLGLMLLLFRNYGSKVLLFMTQGVTCFILLYDYFNNEIRINELLSKYTNVSLSVYGIGCYILMIASVVSVVLTLVRSNEKYR